MSGSALVGVLVATLTLGLLHLLFRSGLRNQLFVIGLVAVAQVGWVVLFEVLPQGGFEHHGNTILGYAVIVVGPFLFVLASTLSLSRFLRRVNDVRLGILMGIAAVLTYWLGLLVSISVAVTLGLASV